MRKPSFLISAAGLGVFVCAFTACAQETQEAGRSSKASHSTHWYSPSRYNPMKWIKRDSKTASEELGANPALEKRLTAQLYTKGALPAKAKLKELCSTFQSLTDCIAAVHASHSLKIEFNCLKFDLTGVDPSRGKSSCAGPPGGKATTLRKSIDLLKPDANARAEAKNALRLARDDISDASS